MSRRVLAIGLFVLASAHPLAAQSPPGPVVSDDVYEAIAEFYDYDVEIPLEAAVVASEDAPTYTREKIVFTGGRGDRVPGYLMLPKAGKSPWPVVMLIDGWTGSKERFWEDDTWPRGGLVTKALAAEGFAALVLDAQYHGERDANLRYVPVDKALCPTCRNRLREMIVESVLDHRRALDYLATRTELDPSRVAVLGHSMGGIMSFALAAIEPRLRAAVPCVTPARTFGEWPGPGPRDARSNRRPVLPHIFAPRIHIPLLMLMGRTDPHYTEAQAQALFELVASPVKALEWYDSGHRLPPEYVSRAVGWIKEQLK